MMGCLKQVQFRPKNHGNCGKIAIFVAKIGKFVAKIVCMQKLCIWACRLAEQQQLNLASDNISGET